jgi:hypothetical protein
MLVSFCGESLGTLKRLVAALKSDFCVKTYKTASCSSWTTSKSSPKRSGKVIFYAWREPARLAQSYNDDRLEKEEKNCSKDRNNHNKQFRK